MVAFDPLKLYPLFASPFYSQVRGLHLNLFSTSILHSPFEYIQAKLFFSEKEQKKIFPVKDSLFKMLAESGYFHEQGTDKL